MLAAEGVLGLDPEWSTYLPDGLLADLLDQRAAAPPDGQSGWERLERVGAWDRIIAWAQAAQLQEIAGFVRDAEAHPCQGARAGEAIESAIAEVGLMLRLSRRGADQRVDDALTFTERLPASLDALGKGQISLAAARIISAETTHLTAEQAAGVEAAVLPKAPHQTPGQVRAAARRAAIKVDPHAAQKRHTQQRGRRAVWRHNELDGMTTLAAYLPAPDAAGMFAVIDEYARRAAAHDDDRSIDARRADALVDLVLNGPTRPVAMSGNGDVGSVVSTDNQRLNGVAGGPCSQRARSRVEVRVTVAATTLLGLDEQPADLAGYGPITAEAARQLSAEGTWRRLLTDPVSGALLDCGTARYVPPASLAEHVRTRDATCRYPGCRVPAHRCDLDHGVPFGPDAGTGSTSADNLSAKCRSHHRLKHQPGWDVRQEPDGTLVWKTPTGHAYPSSPAPLAEPPPRRPALTPTEPDDRYPPF